jgi:trehalose 6-phosphate synthase/phosphatase
LKELLRALSAVPGNHVAIVSGRPRRDLEAWFGGMPVTLIGEHGAWLRPQGGEWRVLKTMATDWKDKVRPILQLHIDRLPGALLEEKEFSLAWHYRRADPELALLRARELRDALAEFTRNIDVQVLEGNKVLEVRNTGVSKGTAALEWLPDVGAHFILAIGDDWTDEDLFRALPAAAYSVRVGLAQTAARYYLASHTGVRMLLHELADGPDANQISRASQASAVFGQARELAAPTVNGDQSVAANSAPPQTA